VQAKRNRLKLYRLFESQKAEQCPKSTFFRRMTAKQTRLIY